MKPGRILNLQISMDNIKSSVELFLRTMGELDESDDVEFITFGTVADFTTVKDWNDMKTVPVQVLVKKKEGVRVYKING